MEEAPAGRGSRRDAALALAAAALVAILVGSQTLSLPPAAGQFAKYPAAALAILHGGHTSERLVDFSPLYLAVHGAAYRHLADPVRGVLLFQAACVAAAAALLFLVLRRHVGLALSVAGVAGLALERSVVVYAGIFEPESLLLLLVTAFLYCAGRRGPAAAAAAGAALSLALLTRPGLLPLALVFPASYLLRVGERRRAAALLFLAPVACGLALLSARNQRATGSWSPVVMNPGTAFFEGNNPLAAGHGAAYPPVVEDIARDAPPGEVDFQHAVYRLLARVDAGRELSVGEANRFWAEKALRFLGDEPGAALRLAGRKALFALHRHRWHDLPAAFAADRELSARGIPATPLALVSALAMVGLATGARRWRELLPAWGLLAGQGALMLAAYPSARQRVAVLPALVVLAAVGAAGLGRGARGAALGGGAALALTALFSRDTDLVRDHRTLWEASLAGGADPAAARPEDRTARFEHARLLIERGRLDEAERLLEPLRREGRAFERGADRVGRPAFYLGRIAALRGRREEAVRLMREALAGAPGDPTVLAHLAALTGEPAHAARIFRYFDDSDARFALGRAFLENGKPEEAVKPLGRLVEDLPEHRRGAELLEAALSARAAAQAAPGPSPGAAP